MQTEPRPASSPVQIPPGQAGSPAAKRASAVQAMFTRIAPRYDLMNRLMSLGQDGSWRREVVRRACLQPGAFLLDLGAGTGDLSFEALRQQPAVRAAAADFTLAMMARGRQRRKDLPVRWSGADACALPFRSAAFDAVISGFLMRNVSDLPASLREQRRVLKPGGRLVCLDTTRPRRSFFSPLIWLHYHAVIPALGRLVTGHADAYTYLPETSERFLTAEALAAHLAAAGFKEIGYRRLMLGTIAIHWAKR